MCDREMREGIHHLLYCFSYSNMDDDLRLRLLHKLAQWEVDTSDRDSNFHLAVTRAVKGLNSSNSADSPEDILFIAEKLMMPNQKTHDNFMRIVLAILPGGFNRIINSPENLFFKALHCMMFLNLNLSDSQIEDVKNRINEINLRNLTTEKKQILWQCSSLNYCSLQISLDNFSIAETPSSISETEKKYVNFLTHNMSNEMDRFVDHCDQGLSIDLMVQYNGEKFAINIDGPFHFFDNTLIPNSKTKLRNTLQEKLGYKVICIDYRRIDSSNPRELLKFLYKKMGYTAEEVSQKPLNPGNLFASGQNCKKRPFPSSSDNYVDNSDDKQSCMPPAGKYNKISVQQTSRRHSRQR